MRHVVRTALAVLAIVAAVASVSAAQSAETAPVRKPPSEAAASRKVTDTPEPVPRRGFNIVLLVGDVQGPGYPKPIPAAAMKAVSDMRDFLPYKGYSLLDTQWIVGGTSSPAVTRLRGLDGQEYELELRASPLLMPGNQQAMSVRFVLRDFDAENDGAAVRSSLHSKEVVKGDSASHEIAREIFQLERERTDLELVLGRSRKQVAIGMKDPDEVRRSEAQLVAVNRRISELKGSLNVMTANAKAGGRPVIDTTFRMDDGETVVVGTSKMEGGGNALIALLTATADRKVSTK